MTISIDFHHRISYYTQGQTSISIDDIVVAINGKTMQVEDGLGGEIPRVFHSIDAVYKWLFGELGIDVQEKHTYG